MIINLLLNWLIDLWCMMHDSWNKNEQLNGFGIICARFLWVLRFTWAWFRFFSFLFPWDTLPAKSTLGFCFAVLRQRSTRKWLGKSISSNPLSSACISKYFTQSAYMTGGVMKSNLRRRLALAYRWRETRSFWSCALHRIRVTWRRWRWRRWSCGRISWLGFEWGSRIIYEAFNQYYFLKYYTNSIHHFITFWCTNNR